jgi:3-hydroxybutyryl-CoA dehydrogenase
MNARPPIACLGAGRMGRGIAVVFAYAGHGVALIDFKSRGQQDFARLAADAQAEVGDTLRRLARCGLFEEEHAGAISERVTVVAESDAGAALRSSEVIFEAVPEILELKRSVLARASAFAGPYPIIASTTSTILADDLADAVAHPRRFLNAHWLNPAYLVPLVELAPAATTDSAVVARMKTLLEAIGKVPVVCTARPGYIVPRIQALAMNEAARMVEEGVASAQDIDKAVKYGFGFRFAVLGLLEFIDWGGGDILYYASRYLTHALGDARYAAPEIVERNMREGRIGLNAGKGFLDYGKLDVEAYRAERLKAFVAMLNFLDLTRPPVLDTP